MLATIAIFAFASTASAATIVSAVGATASSDAGGDFDIGNTIDQSGLSVGYISGVTDFDAYIGANPNHNFVALNNEWYTLRDVTTATINYDLGSVMSIDRLALWNEDAPGFGAATIFTSIDNVIFTVLTTIFPANNPINANYLAEIFGFATISARYFELQVSGCPQPSNGGYIGCAIGEIAFSSVPLPAALPLFGTALGLMGFLGWRRKRASAA